MLSYSRDGSAIATASHPPPHLTGQYVGTIICVLVFGLTSIALKTWVSVTSMGWKARAAAKEGGSLAAQLAARSPSLWWLPTKDQVGSVKGVSKVSVCCPACAKHVCR